MWLPYRCTASLVCAVRRWATGAPLAGHAAGMSVSTPLALAMETPLEASPREPFDSLGQGITKAPMEATSNAHQVFNLARLPATYVQNTASHPPKTRFGMLGVAVPLHRQLPATRPPPTNHRMWQYYRYFTVIIRYMHSVRRSMHAYRTFLRPGWRCPSPLLAMPAQAAGPGCTALVRFALQSQSQSQRWCVLCSSTGDTRNQGRFPPSLPNTSASTVTHNLQANATKSYVCCMKAVEG